MTQPQSGIEWRKILCAIDFSPSSRAALHHAIDLTRCWGAELTLLHVYRMPTLQYPDSPAQSFALVDEIERRTSAALERWRAVAERELGGASKLTALLEVGSPARRVVDLAHKLGADLIVIGTHGRTGVGRLLLGSVAERVVRRASSAVLTVPGEHPPPEGDVPPEQTD